tara:strand:+ start:74 stop:394 length:321 start_codon:yes stop_codon:yes gene_type:complete
MRRVPGFKVAEFALQSVHRVLHGGDGHLQPGDGRPQSANLLTEHLQSKYRVELDTTISQSKQGDQNSASSYLNGHRLCGQVFGILRKKTQRVEFRVMIPKGNPQEG